MSTLDSLRLSGDALKSNPPPPCARSFPVQRLSNVRTFSAFLGDPFSTEFILRGDDNAGENARCPPSAYFPSPNRVVVAVALLSSLPELEFPIADVSLPPPVVSAAAFAISRARAVPDRVVALLPYLVPLLDGLRYSRFFFQQFPQTIFLLQPLQPLASMYYRIPFAGVISFFAIYMGLAENRQMSRFVRFNAMQAIIVDVCLVLPGMIEYVLSPGRMSGAAMEMYKLCYNCVWVVVLAAFCLAAVGCLSGQMFKLPFVGDAADMRI